MSLSTPFKNLLNHFNLSFLFLFEIADVPTAIEIWMIWCIVSTFLILLQNGYVMVIAREKEISIPQTSSDKRLQRSKKCWKPREMFNSVTCLHNSFGFDKRRDIEIENQTRKDFSKKVDQISFGISVILFCIFNSIFWATYL